MAGIYFHIPFCKVKCSYCDFYKTTDTSRIEELLSALKHELWLQRNYLSDTSIETIYFGGGTPSLLNSQQITMLIDCCKGLFDVSNDAEITLEANPDDLSEKYLNDLYRSPVNRLSIGIQSFFQSDLKLMKRRHNPTQALNAVKNAHKAGFTNISVDLIYGVPGMSFEQWRENLQQVFQLGVKHLSAYHLTYHKGTQLYDDLHRGKLNEVDEQESVIQFEELVNQAEKNDFIHYEISNFAQEGCYAKHNSSYWNQTEYLGIGPSAHSYNKTTRQWNVASLNHYMLAIKHGKVPFESEALGINERFNDYIITALRTMWGIDLDFVTQEFGEKLAAQLQKTAAKYSDTGKLLIDKKHIKLAYSGKLISDSIMSDLMQ
ncbi:radical SAM family heme chaperone HemW [Roseimarinus sediminis]|uniref:radical SAM family heme chaperone HemW n=1 Tax=Roseimarinus sediminis TaxID=1610899 RepID=UPI003D1FEE88